MIRLTFSSLLTYILTASLAVCSVVAFSLPSIVTQRSSTTIKTPSRRCLGLQGSVTDREPSDMDESKRMDLVRSIQKSYYNSPSTSVSISSMGDEEDIDADVFYDGTPPQLSPETGILKNLPLWRVGWTEVPGRSNVLTVDEGHYTHMFETILRGADGDDKVPRYFGHLYLPGGTKSSRSGEKRFALKSWKEEVADKERYISFERSVVVGCLMRINDYRRLDDGRLILHVQALERFVVDKVVREFPYSVANVQLLPDVEQLGECVSNENTGKPARAAAVRRALHHYHRYEFASTQLPLPKEPEYLKATQVSDEEMAELMPHAEYNLDEAFSDDDADDDVDELTKRLQDKSSRSSEPLQLEHELEREGILQDIAVSDKSDAAGMEQLVWLALATLSQNSDIELPDELLCLMPPELDYLDIAPERLLDEDYPELRRQSRLSFAASTILEQPGMATAVRQAMLQIPSTTARLAAVLQQLQQMNRQYERLIQASRKGFE